MILAKFQHVELPPPLNSTCTHTYIQTVVITISARPIGRAGPCAWLKIDLGSMKLCTILKVKTCGVRKIRTGGRGHASQILGLHFVSRREKGRVSNVVPFHFALSVDSYRNLVRNVLLWALMLDRRVSDWTSFRRSVETVHCAICFRLSDQL